jgi:hypothetical protein
MIGKSAESVEMFAAPPLSIIAITAAQGVRHGKVAVRVSWSQFRG